MEHPGINVFVVGVVGDDGSFIKYGRSRARCRAVSLTFGSQMLEVTVTMVYGIVGSGRKGLIERNGRDIIPR
jgi:hypothetical protein